MSNKYNAWIRKHGDRLLIYLAVTSILIALIDLSGILDSGNWIKQRIPAITLLMVNSILLAILIERYTKLSRIERILKQSLDTYAQGVQYLEDGNLVLNELIDLVKDSSEFVYALGGKSSSEKYLNVIALR
jgi:hypothetical protein